MKPDKVCLVDGSHLAFRNLIALPDLRAGNIKTGVVYGVLKSLLKIAKKFHLGLVDIVVCWDFGKSDWRLALYPEYKAGRHKGGIDIISYRNQLKLLREALTLLGLAQFGVQGIEADDLIGILSERFHKEGRDVLVCSGDQDMYQLVKDGTPSIVVIKPPNNDMLGEEEIVKKLGVTPKQVPDFKALVGDKSDNIIGIKGVGKVKASKLLKEYKWLEVLLREAGGQKKLIKSMKVQERYREAVKNIPDGRLLLNKKLTTILREADTELLTENQIFEIENWSLLDVEKQNMLEFSKLLARLQMTSLVGTFYDFTD